MSSTSPLHLSFAEERALNFLFAHGPSVASMVGAYVWPDRKGRTVPSRGGGDFAAQMLLGRLRKLELVRVQSDTGSSKWELSDKGQARMRTK